MRRLRGPASSSSACCCGSTPIPFGFHVTIRMGCCAFSPSLHPSLILFLSVVVVLLIIIVVGGGAAVS